MRFPAVFVNHGGGPMPLMGKQPVLVKHMKELTRKILPSVKPKAIVIISAHWEGKRTVEITSSSHPEMTCPGLACAAQNSIDPARIPGV
jgi:4,5-DOPA dioxygenase extradiol